MSVTHVSYYSDLRCLHGIICYACQVMHNKIMPCKPPFILRFWPIKTKINTSSSTSPRGVPKQKNQHLQFRIEIMPKKRGIILEQNTDSVVMWTISRRTLVMLMMMCLSLFWLVKMSWLDMRNRTSSNLHVSNTCFLLLWLKMFTWHYLLCMSSNA
jgi:hypothetical protein